MNKNYDILDITKFILSIFIVAIHTGLLPNILFPWLRLAIPLFFIISSYLLHSKTKGKKKDEKKAIIKKYIQRNLILYAFWFVALLPITIYARKEWFEPGILSGIWTTITQTLFSSTFIASWYISATIIGTLIVEYLSERIKKLWLMPILLSSYAICCFTSSYSFLFQGNDFIKIIAQAYSSYLPRQSSAFQ